MHTYEVEVTRRFSVTVSVHAASAEDAIAQVDRDDFPLPARDEWTGHKDWTYSAVNLANDADTAEKES